jgi:hypothetical protein
MDAEPARAYGRATDSPTRRHPMGRKMIDCRRHDFTRLDGSECTITLAGEESQLFTEAIEHARSAHGMDDTPELREQIAALLADEASVTA